MNSINGCAYETLEKGACLAVSLSFQEPSAVAMTVVISVPLGQRQICVSTLITLPDSARNATSMELEELLNIARNSLRESALKQWSALKQTTYLATLREKN